MRREQWLRIDGKGGLPLGQMPISRVCDLDRSVGLRARGRPSLLSPLPLTMQPKFPMLWFASPIHRLRYESPQREF
jgi:hypothetical protein